MHSQFLLFLGVAALLTITSGADMAVVTKVALSAGRRRARLTTLGINTGIMVWGVASAAGLAAVLTASSTIFTGIKLIGAAYLLWLGARAIWKTFSGGAGARAGDVLRRPSIRRALDRITGVVLIGLGLRLATASR